MSATAVLRAESLRVGYGGKPVLLDVSIELKPKEVLCVIGHNGAGKSTLMRTLFGLVRPEAGRVLVDGNVLPRHLPRALAAQGVAMVPEGRGIFPGLTVRENLELGLSAERRRSAAVRAERLEQVFHHFPRLKERINQTGKTLSGGEQQMLAIARVMMAGAKLILMDEPTQGLAPALVRHIREIIGEVKRLGVTVFLVEQNARMALSVCDRG